MIEGLQRAIEIIKKEKEYAIRANTQMALGMAQVLRLIEKELEKEEEKDFRENYNSYIEQ